MTAPAARSAGVVSGWPAASSAYGRKPGDRCRPRSSAPRRTPSFVARPFSQASPKRSCATNAFASQSRTMYAISGAVEVPVDRHEVHAGLRDGEVELDDRRVVRQHRRDAVALAQPERAQAVHDAVARRDAARRASTRARPARRAQAPRDPSPRSSRSRAPPSSSSRCFGDVPRALLWLRSRTSPKQRRRRVRTRNPPSRRHPDRCRCRRRPRAARAVSGGDRAARRIAGRRCAGGSPRRRPRRRARHGASSTP